MSDDDENKPTSTEDAIKRDREIEANKSLHPDVREAARQRRIAAEQSKH